MKNLLYFLPLILLFSSCAALRPPQITSKSPRFYRYYEAAKKCFFTPEKTVIIDSIHSKGKLKLGTGMLSLVWKEYDSLGVEIRNVCAITPDFHFAGTTVHGIFTSFSDEHERNVSYAFLNKVFFYEECPVLGEKELNEKITEKIAQKVNIWASLFKARAP